MKAFRIALALSLAIGAGQKPVPTPTENADDRALFAVLRRDGVITPFALLRGRGWSAPWPVGLRVRELPLNLEAVPDYWWGGTPPPEEWQAWLSEGRKQTITLQKPVPYIAHCSRRMGIRTDYQTAQALPRGPVQPFPKDGIAVSNGNLVLEQVEIVSRAGESWASLALSLLEDFNRAEDSSANAIASMSGWRHPVRRADRRTVGVRLESWYRASLPDREAVSYIEAVRSYEPRPEDEGCGLETFFSGWVFHRADRPRPETSLRAKVTYCDRVGAMFMLPFGLVRLQDRVHWIYQLSGWEDEWYVVTETRRRSARPLVEYYAGGSRCE